MQDFINDKLYRKQSLDHLVCVNFVMQIVMTDLLHVFMRASIALLDLCILLMIPRILFKKF